ncbi:XYLEM SERINE PROTEINASE 1 [Salix purpurea]|uniref:XYLEM SERINE PROTEINASE 1 n=1 Tax=Salix purpurea TaxID=77065 RepID=A0A9Q0PRS4_SALPP|nr:XYLEM SERINE PROTEINASE 1 [Salix purpurea]
MAPFLSSSFLLLLSFLPLFSLSLSTVDQPYKTYIIRIDSQSKPSIFPTHYHWYTTEFTNSPQILHTYDTVFHGFSAVLTPDHAATLSRHPSVLAVIEDQRKQLHTTRSPQFLGLRNQRGLWSGVFVSSSAGNDGPYPMSVTNLAPWIATVGAGTIDRSFPAVVVLGNGKRLSGVSLYAGLPLSGKMYSLVYPGKSGVLASSLCMENSLDPNMARGKIVVCDRGSSPRVAKGLVVKKAGGVGMILANGISNGEGLVGDAHLIPACALGSDEGDALKAYVSSTSNPVATIAFKGTVIGIKPAPVVASFSGRGPNGLSPEILKPDLIAPGVNILAAWTDAAGPTGLESDLRKTEFNILSGTSMACPHVSGAAALLKSAHPDWSPAAIRSAMMTTANTFNNLNQPLTDEATGNFLCGIGYEPRVIQVITRSPVSCPVKKPLPEHINYPSLAALFPNSAKGASSKTFIRTVTNVGQPDAVYRSTIQAPRGAAVTVKPQKLVFSRAVKKRSFIVTVTANTRNLIMGNSGAVFGSISWSDGKHFVRSPIVVVT